MLLHLISTLSMLMTLSLPWSRVQAWTDSCVMLTSAFHWRGQVYLVDKSGWFIQLNSRFQEVKVDKMYHKFGVPDGEVDAVFQYAENGKLCFFQGHYFYQYEPSRGRISKRTKRNTDIHTLIYSGADAAATMNSSFSYIFRGCRYVRGKRGSPVADLRSLGLPCHLNAAWGLEGKLYVVKGNDYYTLDAHDKVSGPKPLASLVNLKKGKFCQMSRLSLKRNYEKKHNCVILDGAISVGGNIIFFHENEALTIKNHQLYANRRLNLQRAFPGLKTPVDAGLFFPMKSTFMIYKESEIFVNGHWQHSVYPFNRLKHWTFQEYINAASTFYKKLSFFIKDCEMVVLSTRPRKKRVFMYRLYSTKMYNLPCHPDAAFTMIAKGSRRRKLYIVKGNKVWALYHPGKKSRRPRPLSDIIRFPWTMCKSNGE